MKKFLAIFRYYRKASWLFNSNPQLVFDKAHKEYRIYESSDKKSEIYEVLHTFDN